MSTCWWEGMALLQNSVAKQQLRMGKIWQVPSAAGALSTLWQSDTHGTRTMVKKMPSRDAYGGGWRRARGFKASMTAYKVPMLYIRIVILCARANPPRHLFHSAPRSNCGAYIRGWRLFAEIRYFPGIQSGILEFRVPIILWKYLCQQVPMKGVG